MNVNEHQYSTLRQLTSLISSGSTPLGGQSVYLDDGPVMLVRRQNVRMNRLDVSDVAYITDEINSQMQRSVVQHDDVLLNITGASIGRVARFGLKDTRANVNQHVCIIRPTRHQLDSRYLEYFLSSPSVQNDIHNRHQHGGTRQALTFAQLAKFEIPLPPLSEQKRIADILDKADAIRRKRQEELKLFDELLKSAFIQMFGNPITNPMEWKLEKLGYVATLDRGKSRHRPRDAKFLYGGPYPLVQTGDITNSNGFVREFSQTYSEVGLAQSRLWPTGTLCITIAANIGKSAVLTFDACFPDSVVGLIPGEKLTIEFVRHWFVAMEKATDAAATQVAQKNINLGYPRNLNIQVPPLTMQRKFSAAVNTIRQSRETVETAFHETESLFNSLVQRAFRGKL